MPRDQIVTLRKFVLNFGGFGDDDKTRRVSIQPINRMNARRFLFFQKIPRHRIHQRVLRTFVRRMNHHPRRFIDNEQRLILIDDSERKRNRHDIRFFAPHAPDNVTGRNRHFRIMDGDAVYRDSPAPFDSFPQGCGKSTFPPHKISQLHRRMCRVQAPLPLHRPLLRKHYSMKLFTA